MSEEEEDYGEPCECGNPDCEGLVPAKRFDWRCVAGSALVFGRDVFAAAASFLDEVSIFVAADMNHRTLQEADRDFAEEVINNIKTL